MAALIGKCSFFIRFFFELKRNFYPPAPLVDFISLLSLNTQIKGMPFVFAFLHRLPHTHTHASTHSVVLCESVFPVCFYANGIFHISLLSVIYLIFLCHSIHSPYWMWGLSQKQIVSVTTRISFISSL